MHMYAELLHRSDFFPGLGWMMLREVYLELRPKWPEAYVFLLCFLVIFCNAMQNRQL